MFSELLSIVNTSKYLILTNSVFILMFIYFASWAWAPYGEEGLLGGPGDPLIWVLSAFPILIVSFVVNLVLAILVLLRLRRGKDWRQIWALLLVGALWGGVLGYDRHRQYNGSLLREDIHHYRSDDRGVEGPTTSQDH
jgi:hypothetical protein